MTETQRFTVFEKARLIGSRALQISQGAPLAMEFTEDELIALKYNPVEIAKREFEAGKMPLDVRRPKPDQ